MLNQLIDLFNYCKIIVISTFYSKIIIISTFNCEIHSIFYSILYYIKLCWIYYNTVPYYYGALLYSVLQPCGTILCYIHTITNLC